VTASHAYVVVRPCGHPIALLVDDDEDRDGLADELADYVRSGMSLQRVPIEEARQIGVIYCSCAPIPIGRSQRRAAR
jgi:hypothetical protein